MYIQTEFLKLVQALEAYHRRRRPGTALPEKEHKERMRQIIEAVPDEHQEWLKEKLKYSNELSLRRRLKDLIDDYSDIVEGYIEEKKLSCKICRYTKLLNTL